MKRFRGLFIAITLFASTCGLVATGTVPSLSAGAAVAHTATVTDTLIYNNVPSSTTDPTINDGRIKLAIYFNGNFVAWTAEHGYHFVSVSIKTRGGWDYTFNSSINQGAQTSNGDVFTYVKAIAVGPPLASTTTTTQPTRSVKPPAPGPKSVGLHIATGVLPAAKLGKPYRVALRIVGASGRRICRLILHSHVPPGLRLQPSCLITGTPRRVGRSRFAVLVTNDGRRVGKTLFLTVVRA